MECGTLYYEYLEICEKCGNEVMEYNEACRHEHRHSWIGNGDEILRDNYKELFEKEDFLEYYNPELLDNEGDIELYEYKDKLILREKKTNRLIELDFKIPHKKLNSFGSLY